MYHHVKDARHPFPWVKGISLKRFREQLAFLQKRYRIIRLADYVLYLRGERDDLPPRVALLTFDDGLREHARVVVPILQRLRLPASFFPITRSVLESKLTTAHKNHFLFHRFAVPELRQFVLRAVSPSLQRIEASPQHRRLAVERYRFDDPDTASFKFFVNHRLPFAVRDRVLDHLFQKHFRDEARIARQFYLSPSDIRAMSTAGFEFGSHSHRHIVLARASAAVQRRELATSKRHLEAMIGKPVTALSYPFGHIGEFNETTIRIAKDLGLQAGLANIDTVNRGRVDPFRIARKDTVLL